MALQRLSAYAKENRSRQRTGEESVDIPFLVLVLLLLAVGLTMLYSASSALYKQIGQANSAVTAE